MRETDSNRRPRAYEARELPLLYPAVRTWTHPIADLQDGGNRGAKWGLISARLSPKLGPAALHGGHGWGRKGCLFWRGADRKPGSATESLRCPVSLFWPVRSTVGRRVLSAKMVVRLHPRSPIAQ